MHRGFTLIELLVVMAIVGTLLTLAVPGFQQALLNARRDAAVMNTLHAVHWARQLAAVRGEAALLCGMGPGGRCNAGSDWSAGLIVADPRGSAWRLLETHRQDLRIRSNRATIRFEPAGSHASPATIVFCDRRGPPAARAVIISRNARPRSSDRDAGGAPLACG